MTLSNKHLNLINNATSSNAIQVDGCVKSTRHTGRTGSRPRWLAPRQSSSAPIYAIYICVCVCVTLAELPRQGQFCLGAEDHVQRQDFLAVNGTKWMWP